MQPYLIALFAGRGIPMLWQGQELGADNVVPDRGFARIGVLRPMPCELFCDEHGRGVLGLVRRLTRLRAAHAELQSGAHHFHNDWSRYQSRGALLFSRWNAQHLSVVALNFSEQDLAVPFTFDRSGPCVELLHGQHNFQATAGQERWLSVPRHYGRIWRIG